MRVTSSLAGRTEEPGPLAGELRVGGFGGAVGLGAWLAGSGVDAVLDATHPFSLRISASAEEACRRVGVPLLRLVRPGFLPVDGDDWTWTGSLAEAAALVDRLGSRVLLTTGRQGVGAFAGVQAFTVVRSVNPPDEPLPAASVVLVDRGPWSVEDERALLEEHGIDLLVTKDSGGNGAKLEAARELGLPVLLVARDDGVGRGASVAEAVAWVMMRA